MVKIHCDRCGAEIKEKHYYTIVVGKAELNPKYEYNLETFGAASSAHISVHTPYQSPFEQLNSQKMYCKQCADDVIYTVNHYTKDL